MPKSKKKTDNRARIPTPSIDLTGEPPEKSSRERAEQKGGAGPAEEHSAVPASQRSDEPPNRGTTEPSGNGSPGLSNEGTGEPRDDSANDPGDAGTGSTASPRSPSRGRPESEEGRSEAHHSGDATGSASRRPLTAPDAPIQRKKLGIHVGMDVTKAYQRAWRDMLEIDADLNKGIVVEAALRAMLADYEEKGRESALWKMVERLCSIESGT